ncbi:unnamed protein product [Larinioides sclopetarius]|uniref:Uncharacterized protein n=1 Tax=Larinioides sclopetarius TaxID=280406 RepID=A0AAV2BZ78_9ARAC
MKTSLFKIKLQIFTYSPNGSCQTFILPALEFCKESVMN